MHGWPAERNRRLGAFFWGMISVVFSPCHLASIPLIVAYVGGQEKTVQARQAGYYSVAFTSGLFITIALIGLSAPFWAGCWGCGQLLADPGGAGFDLGGLGHAGGGEVLHVRHPFIPSQSERDQGGPGSRPGLWGPLRVLHLRFYRPHPGHHHHSKRWSSTGSS